ncbi:MAG TPA: DoxX family protein [Edaphobacter sp.]
MSKFLNNLQPWGAFLMRLVLGVAMMVHGYSKVVPAGGFHRGNTFSALEHFAHYVSSLGLPWWLGYVSALTEFLGGLLILLGLLTRFAAFMIACNMAVALLLVNRHHGYSGSEYSLALFVIALMLLFYGAGNVALDRKIGLS